MSSPALEFPRLEGIELAAWEAFQSFAPPPKLTLSEWADENYILSAESSAEAGTWRTLAYQKGIMDAISDPDVREVTVQKSTRVGYTKILNCAIGYYAQHDPCGILVVQPTVEDAEGYSKDELAPMLRDVEVLEELIAAPRSRDSSNTILKKHFIGGAVLSMVGANSGRGFRRLTKRIVLFDEVDAYPLSAGGEGDPIELGKKRTTWAWDYKHIIGSSPKIAGVSRVETAFEFSDQRYFFVPCPYCDHGQRLRWGGPDVDYGIKWDGRSPEEAFYLCENCHEQIEHSEKEAMVAQGEWRAEKPFEGHAGFHIWAAYSPAPDAAWGKIAKRFLRSKEDPVKFQVFVNTDLGETWEAKYDSLDDENIAARREAYPEREGRPVVPRGAVVMTASVDTQDDRLEAQVEAWGRGEENWKLEHYVLHGDPSGGEVWDDLWEFLSRPRRLERGGVDYVRATCVDTGGHHTLRAYEFCRPRHRIATPDGRRAYVFAIRGSGGPGKNLWPIAPSIKNKAKIPVYTLKVDLAKDAIYARLEKVERPGPGYIHFPKAFGEAYFQQLTAEKAVPGTDKSGFPTRTWELKSAGRRNEALDLSVYAMAALEGLKTMGFDLEKEATRVEALGVEIDAEVPAAAAPTPPRPNRKRTRRKSTSSFLDRR